MPASLALILRHFNGGVHGHSIYLSGLNVKPLDSGADLSHNPPDASERSINPDFSQGVVPTFSEAHYVPVGFYF